MVPCPRLDGLLRLLLPLKVHGIAIVTARIGSHIMNKNIILLATDPYYAKFIAIIIIVVTGTFGSHAAMIYGSVDIANSFQRRHYSVSRPPASPLSDAPAALRLTAAGPN